MTFIRNKMQLGLHFKPQECLGLSVIIKALRWITLNCK